MRHVHRAGEKLFVDYCGPTMTIVNPHTGEFREAQIFVAVLGASNYTFACASWSQKQADWLCAHVKDFEFFGGVLAVEYCYGEPNVGYASVYIQSFALAGVWHVRQSVL